MDKIEKISNEFKKLSPQEIEIFYLSFDICELLSISQIILFVIHDSLHADKNCIH